MIRSYGFLLIQCRQYFWKSSGGTPNGGLNTQVGSDGLRSDLLVYDGVSYYRRTLKLLIPDNAAAGKVGLSDKRWNFKNYQRRHRDFFDLGRDSGNPGPDT